jgi:hypothetical protein
MMEIENDYQALVLALKLTVTAPTAAKAQECIEMAESFAASLSSEQIQRAKRETSQ